MCIRDSSKKVSFKLTNNHKNDDWLDIGIPARGQPPARQLVQDGRRRRVREAWVARPRDIAPPRRAPPRRPNRELEHIATHLTAGNHSFEAPEQFDGTMPRLRSGRDRR